MSDANKALIRRALETMNEHDASAFFELCPDCTYHSSATGELKGEPFRKFFTTAMAAFPDFRVTVQDQISERDKVVTRYVMSGTHRGEFMGIAPTGKQITLSGLCLDRIVKGKIVEEWDEWDCLSMMRQLGMAPPTKVEAKVAAQTWWKSGASAPRCDAPTPSISKLHNSAVHRKENIMNITPKAIPGT